MKCLEGFLFGEGNTFGEGWRWEGLSGSELKVWKIVSGLVARMWKTEEVLVGGV